MVELEVWYDQIPANDFHPGDPAILVRTPAELDALIDRVRAETRGHRVPAMVQINIAGRKRLPVLEVGLGQSTGFIHLHSENSGRTIGDGNATGTAEYVYMGHLNEMPADSEVPIDTVRHALHEFLDTGERPAVLRD